MAGEQTVDVTYRVPEPGDIVTRGWSTRYKVVGFDQYVPPTGPAWRGVHLISERTGRRYFSRLGHLYWPGEGGRVGQCVVPWKIAHPPQPELQHGPGIEGEDWLRPLDTLDWHGYRIRWVAGLDDGPILVSSHFLLLCDTSTTPEAARQLLRDHITGGGCHIPNVTPGSSGGDASA